MAETLIVVPCYNEAGRLPVDGFLDGLATNADVDFIFVNDGSSDDTLEILRKLEAREPTRLSVIDQQPNRGKAEAVRAGMLAAFERGPRYAGFFDADLATSLDEIPRMRRVFERDPVCEIVLGARVQLLGRDIQRRKARHYLGRVFATLASEALGLRVYDTQCGAKLFRVTPTTEALFAEPFVANWVFDVEIIARLIEARAGTREPPAERAVYELPLDRWIDVAGSKVKPTDFFRAIWEMAWIYRRYLRSLPRDHGGPGR